MRVPTTNPPSVSNSEVSFARCLISPPSKPKQEPTSPSSPTTPRMCHLISLERSRSFRAQDSWPACPPLQPDHSVNKTMSSIFMGLGPWPICSGLKSPSNRDVLILSAPACSTIGAWSKKMKKKIFLRFGARRWLEPSGVHLTATAEERQSKKWAPSAQLCHPLPMDLGPFQEIPSHSLAASVEPAYGEKTANCSVLVPPSRKKATRTLDRPPRN